MSQKIISMLRAAPLLEGLDEALLAQLAESGRSKVYKGRLGRIDAEELCRRLHFVISGEMHMLRITPEGQQCLIQRFATGEFFCLSSVFTGRCCGSQMVSAGTSQLLSWPQIQFRQLLSADAGFYRNLLQQIAKQLEQERELRVLSRCSRADIKLAAYLLHKLCPPGCNARHCSLVVDLRPISLTAQELGIARETLSRSLQRLVRMEGISYQGGRVRITDVRCLEQVLAEADCSCRSG